MSSAHSISTPCTCMNNTSCNQPKVVTESEIQAPIGKEWQPGVGTLELLAACEVSYCLWVLDTFSLRHQQDIYLIFVCGKPSVLGANRFSHTCKLGIAKTNTSFEISPWCGGEWSNVLTAVPWPLMMWSTLALAHISSGSYPRCLMSSFHF